MANTDITQRAQYERSDLLAGGEGIRRGSEKGAAVYTVLTLIIGIAFASSRWRRSTAGHNGSCSAWSWPSPSP